MTDKEVGELWEKRIADLEAIWTDRKGASAFELDMVISLIRKLVEERRARYEASNKKHWNDLERKPIDAYAQALCDYGIPEEGWE